MKITIEQTIDNQKFISTRESTSETASELIDDFCGLMVSAGFHPESVKSAILEKAEEYTETNE